MWYAFECYAHKESSSGLVFDLRLAGDVAAPSQVKCPLCGCVCVPRAHWPADENGYGSSGDGAALAERRHGELLHRWDQLLTLLRPKP